MYVWELILKNMKKIKLNSKLSLNKETVAKLNDTQMNAINGGGATGGGGGENPGARPTVFLCTSTSSGCSAKSCSTILCLPF